MTVSPSINATHSKCSFSNSVAGFLHAISSFIHVHPIRSCIIIIIIMHAFINVFSKRIALEAGSCKDFQGTFQPVRSPSWTTCISIIGIINCIQVYHDAFRNGNARTKLDYVSIEFLHQFSRNSVRVELDHLNYHALKGVDS